VLLTPDNPRPATCAVKTRRPTAAVVREFYDWYLALLTSEQGAAHSGPRGVKKYVAHQCSLKSTGSPNVRKGLEADPSFLSRPGLGEDWKDNIPSLNAATAGVSASTTVTLA